MAKKNSIVCFGEVLWDVLPTHKVAGGAPMNVAFHANNFGMGFNWQACLEFACATGALVATKSGGTPVINESLVTEFIQNHK